VCGDDSTLLCHVPMPPQSGSPTETSPPLVKPVIFTRFAQDVFFFSDEAEVGTRGLRLVQDLVQEFISRHAASEYLADIFVVGHTDNVGTEEYNMELSRKRASNLIQVFKGQFSRYSTAPRVYYDYIGVGESQPIKQYSKETESHQNRRAEIFFSDQAGTGKNAAAYLDCLRRYRSRPRNCLTHYQDLWKPLNASAANSP
jgi:outer membrane protein OmpA-like peptidoglycan-associated protein